MFFIKYGAQVILAWILYPNQSKHTLFLPSVRLLHIIPVWISYFLWLSNKYIYSFIYIYMVSFIKAISNRLNGIHMQIVSTAPEVSMTGSWSSMMSHLDCADPLEGGTPCKRHLNIRLLGMIQDMAISVTILWKSYCHCISILPV